MVGRENRQGRFTTKRKEQWKENVRIAAKRRKSVSDSEIINANLEGRRIVELRQFFDNLWCVTCDFSLSLNNFVLY